jgi:hypothetical protein
MAGWNDEPAQQHVQICPPATTSQQATEPEQVRQVHWMGSHRKVASRVRLGHELPCKLKGDHAHVLGRSCGKPRISVVSLQGGIRVP